MINALIVDDESNNRQVLYMLLRNHCPAINIIHEASNVETAYNDIISYKPKLVFLDINMPGKNGFDLLKLFTKIEFEVIFVTAYDQYAIRAFEFNAIDYIIKPISVSRLANAVNRVVERIRINDNSDIILHFVKTISETNELSHKLSVHHNDKVQIVDIIEIASVQVSDDRTTITLKNGTRYYSSKDLVRFETLFQDMQNFMRVSKSVIVNILAIKSYTKKGDPFIIELNNDQVFEVSRRRKSDILRIIKAKF